MRNVSLKSKVTSCIYPIQYITNLKNMYNTVEGLMFTDNKSERRVRILTPLDEYINHSDDASFDHVMWTDSTLLSSS